MEVGLRAIPRVNSTRFSTFAIKGRTYPSAATPFPSALLYLSRSIPRCLCGCRIDARPTDFINERKSMLFECSHLPRTRDSSESSRI